MPAASPAGAPGKKPAPDHFILFRRLSQRPAKDAAVFGAIESASGIGQSDLRYRLAGPGLGVLLPKIPPEQMADCAAELADFGMPAMVLAKSDLRGASLPPQAKRVHLTQEAIEFQTAEEKAILRIDKSSELLVIATDLTGKAVKELLTTIAYSREIPEKPFAEALKKLSMSRGAALLYDMRHNPAKGVLIDSGAFVFLGLDDKLTPSGSLNFRVMIDEAMHLSKTAATDHYFGIAALPGTKPEWDLGDTAVGRRLALYAQYLAAAWRKGLFQEKVRAGASGPGEAAASPRDKQEDAHQADEEGLEDLKAPPPVEEPFFQRLLQGSMSEIIGGLIGLLAFFLFFVSDGISFSGHPRFWHTAAGLAVALGGAGLFCYALLLLYYKRMVENTPTSKVRSLSMGMAELSGRARPYYALRTAYTLTRCIFYISRYYKYQRYGDSSSWRLTRTISSGKLAFYLEDETGKVLIDPRGAFYATSRSRQTLRGRFIPSLAIKLDDPNTRVIEDMIPVGANIYVLGSAHLRRERKKHRERLVDRLRAVKQDPEKMARYDSDGDGHIDAQEWDAARADIETRVYAESLAGESGARETVVVEKPRFGLLPFIVADSEQRLIRKLAIRSWLFLGFGGVAFACGIGMLI